MSIGDKRNTGRRSGPLSNTIGREKYGDICYEAVGLQGGDPDVCMRCGLEGNVLGGMAVQTLHFDLDQRNDTLSNLVRFCVRCRIKHQKLFSRFLRLGHEPLEIIYSRPFRLDGRTYQMGVTFEGVVPQPEQIALPDKNDNAALWRGDGLPMHTLWVWLERQGVHALRELVWRDKEEDGTLHVLTLDAMLAAMHWTTIDALGIEGKPYYRYVLRSDAWPMLIERARGDAA